MHVKNLFSLVVMVSLLTSCGDAVHTQSGNPSSSLDSLPVKENALGENPSGQEGAGPVEGFYVGDFNALVSDQKKSPMQQNRINISVDSIRGDQLFGHSVVAGNIRPFSGTYLLEEGNYVATCREPGNDRYDGVFVFTIYPENGTLTGTWTANDHTLAVSKRNYALTKRVFTYDPNQGIADIAARLYNSNPDAEEGELITEDAGKINASLTALKRSDVENMYKRDLEVMRNAIYARHGYSFKNREMRFFFDTEVDWYIPVSTNVSEQLTELEKQNIALIKRYEKHASSYYDSFGR